jgi:homoserine O-succinyltransferase
MTERALRVGILNLMPKAETYEPYLLQPLRRVHLAVEPILLKLESHGYACSDSDYIATHYEPIERVLKQGPLDGLIVSGAPVEELDFQEVSYWQELRELLLHARHNISSTLGLCWGGLALASLLGLEKHRYPIKLFGVFHNRSLAGDGPFLSDADDVFACAHSRHTGIADEALVEAQDSSDVRLLAYGRETGYSIFESPDHRYLIHLGHPEYEAGRLAHEWKRDRFLRHDVLPPVNLDLAAPMTTWRSHRAELFSTWLRFIAQRDRAGLTVPSAVSPVA